MAERINLYKDSLYINHKNTRLRCNKKGDYFYISIIKQGEDTKEEVIIRLQKDEAEALQRYIYKRIKK